VRTVFLRRNEAQTLSRISCTTVCGSTSGITVAGRGDRLEYTALFAWKHSIQGDRFPESEYFFPFTDHLPRPWLEDLSISASAGGGKHFTAPPNVVCTTVSWKKGRSHCIDCKERQMIKPYVQVAASLFLVFLAQQKTHAQFGATLSGVGPVSRSMAGATTAAPVDTLGAFQWNPATISALPSSMDFGLELLLPHSTLASTVNAGSLAPGFPAATVSGSNNSDTGVFPLPEFGVVLNSEDSDFSYGLGVLAVGGFGVNYPGSSTNPMLTPPLPNGLGVGPIYTQYQMMQVIPTVSYQASERLSIGFSPIINLAGLSADPGILAAPDNAGGSGFPTYPPMNHGAFQWGAGFQLGAFYVTDSDWQYGASFKSTQWFKDFEYNSRDQVGASRQIQYKLDAPMIISVGTAYTGFEKWLLAVDGRYLNYSDTRGFSSTGFTPTGAISGLGWNDIYALSLGSQYQMTDAASMRLGYSFNTNPIDDENAFYNVGSPLIIQHGAYMGASYDVTARFTVSFAYSHYFENSISGPIQSPGGPIPGTNVTSSASADSLLFGATVTF